MSHAIARARAFALVALTLGAAPPPPQTHSTHNAKHGGLFYPVAQDTLHIEAVWPQQRVLKLYVYDASSRSVTRERMREIRGVVRAGGAEAPLIPAAEDGLFQARIPPLKMPAEIFIEITLSKDAPPESFQLTFLRYSDEDALSFNLEPTVIPRTRRGILGALRDDVRDAERLVKQQNTAYVFAPAIRGRDRVLALEQFLPELPAVERPRAEAAIRTAVRIAWLLHLAGDDGTSAQVMAAVGAFRAAVLDVADAFGEGR